jgi:hypothetical protein
MSKNSHVSNPPLTQNQNNAMSDDPGDGHRLTDKPGPIGSTPVENNKPAHDEQDAAAIEEFGREGMGVSAKE